MDEEIRIESGISIAQKPPHTELIQAAYAFNDESVSGEELRKHRETVGQELNVFLKNNDIALSPFELNLVLDLVSGPYTADRSLLVDETYQGKLTPEQKASKARMMHNISHVIFYTSLGMMDEEEVGNIYEMIKVIDGHANSTRGEAEGLKKWWNGLKAQLAIMRALHEQEYEIFLPNYAQNPYVGEDPVLDWDVYNGIDLVAIKEGKAHFINCKGEHYLDHNYHNGMRNDVEVRKKKMTGKDIQRQPKDLHKMLLRRGIHTVENDMVIVPTDLAYLPPLAEGRADDGSIYELAGFGRLSPSLSYRIAEELEDNTHYY